MSIHVGDRVRPVNAPDVVLTVDHVAPQGSDHTLLAAHDTAGHPVYLSGEDCCRPEDCQWPDCPGGSGQHEPSNPDPTETTDEPRTRR